VESSVNSLVKNVVVWAAIVVAILVVYKFVQAPQNSSTLLDSNSFSEALEAGRVSRVSLPRDATVEGELSENGPDGKPVRFRTVVPAYQNLVDELRRRNVDIQYYSERKTSPLTYAMTWVPFLVLATVWVVFFRRIQAAQKKSGGQPGTPHEA
jgi:ATP-dependent Zn protease